MKTHNAGKVVAILLALAATSQAATQYHDFLLKDGRSFRGRIVAYDQHNDVVQIVRDNKRLIKTTLTVFDEADQLHIKEWFLIRCFESEKLFKITAGRNTYKGEKDQQPLFFGNGSRTIYLRHLRYTIGLENNSVLALRNMTAEYRIFYHHEHREMASHKWIKDEGVKCGSLLISRLEPKSSSKLASTDIILNPPAGYPKGAPALPSPYNKEAVVDGIWIRITLPLSKDRTAVREYTLPDTLSKRHKWAVGDSPVGLNKTLKKATEK